MIRLLKKSFFCSVALTLSIAAFADRQELIVRKNQLSPEQCGLEFIEVGFNNGGSPDMHLALWRDKFDSSFGDTKPLIRKVYDYNMPASSTKFGDGEPNDIINIAKRRPHIAARVVWELAQFAAYSVPYVAPVYYVSTEFVDAYVRRDQYHRRQVTQLLNYMLEQNPNAMADLVSPEEIKSITGSGEEYTFAGLFVNQKVSEQVWDFNQDERHLLRAQNYSRLVNIMNREGLIARPLSKDFVVVYLDPTKKYARDLDTVYTDLRDLPKIKDINGTELVPLGVYGIGQKNQRIVTLDFSEPKRIKHRKAAKYLADLGVKAGVALVAQFPYKILIYASDKAARFALNKEGTNIFSDMIESEAELAMLLQTGLAQLSPELMNEAKKELKDQQLNVFIRADGNPEKNRANNQRNMNIFLQKQAKSLCKQAESSREKNYRSTYLSFAEKTSRFFRTLMPFSNKEKLFEERKNTIAARFDVVAARNVLSQYDPARKNKTEDEVVAALNVLGSQKNDDDVELISRLMANPGTERIEQAAVEAAQRNGSGYFTKPLAELLNKYEFDASTMGEDPTIIAALQALSTLRYNDTNEPINHYDAAIAVLKEKAQRPQLADAKDELTKAIDKINFERNIFVERQWNGY